MIPSNQEKLDEMYEIVLENNEILRGLIRRERVATLFKIVYWLIILGGIFGAYYYLEPVVKNLSGNLEGLQNGIEKLNTASNSLPEVNTIKNLFNSFKK
jgi:hypothetical protein